MLHSIVHENFPIFVLKVDKADCRFATLDDVVAHFVALAEAHPVARLISVFDHYAHTKALADGEIGPGIVGAVNIVVCFGLAIAQPECLALRPRSIGVAELGERFVISFLETPMPVANAVMEEWACDLVTRG
ncbi:DUF6858 family protein [Breoghania sp.]|uniref:DUF6858 family protein n=1 Tax=Breoghania sp. TaxID=2065378 RepID=UPI002AAB9523|nr:hypothetical protein [Breoghania sp.]